MKIVLAMFRLENKDKKSYIIDKTFLLACLSLDIILKMLFLTLNNIKVNFINFKISWGTWIFILAIAKTKKAKSIGKKDIIVIAFGLLRNFLK